MILWFLLLCWYIDKCIYIWKSFMILWIEKCYDGFATWKDLMVSLLAFFWFWFVKSFNDFIIEFKFVNGRSFMFVWIMKMLWCVAICSTPMVVNIVSFDDICGLWTCCVWWWWLCDWYGRNGTGVRKFPNREVWSWCAPRVMSIMASWRWCRNKVGRCTLRWEPRLIGGRDVNSPSWYVIF